MTDNIVSINKAKQKIFKLLLLVVFISGCNSGTKNNFSVLPISVRSTENRICAAYFKHIEKRSTSEFPLHEIHSHPGLFLNQEVSQKFISDPDLVFYPATLWQLYALTKSNNWKQLAINYNLCNKMDDYYYSSSNLYSGEIIQSVFLTSYRMSGEEECAASIVKMLSKHILKLEANTKARSNGASHVAHQFDRLLENRVLFFATEKSGDPAYRDFAIENSLRLYQHVVNNEPRIRSVLKNDTPDLQVLTTADFKKLAFLLSGFTALYKETGRGDYLQICKKIASLFQSVFGSKNGSMSPEKQQLANRIDILSKSFVGLALFDLADSFNRSYSDTSAKIYLHILNILECKNKTIENVENDEADDCATCRLFYYLFEYEIRKQKEG